MMPPHCFLKRLLCPATKLSALIMILGRYRRLTLPYPEITARGMLFIKHQPIFGEVQTPALDNSHRLYSIVIAYVEDSLYLCKNCRRNYTAYQMSNTTGNTGNRINVAFRRIDYYLFAKDASGRRENHP